MYANLVITTKYLSSQLRSTGSCDSHSECPTAVPLLLNRSSGRDLKHSCSSMVISGSDFSESSLPATRYFSS